MNRKLLALAIAGTLFPAVASAQETSAVEGPGYPVGEGTVVHPTLGAELGFTDNVFYGDAQYSRYASGILRLVAEASIASQEIQPEPTVAEDFADPGDEEVGAEPAHQKVQFRFGGRLAYQEYVSPDDLVRAQRDLAADLAAQVVIAPQGTFSFALDERFTRDTRPTNFQSSEGVDRDANALALALNYQPGGHELSAGLRWENHFDFFESTDQRFANRMENYIHATSEWRFFPYSKVFADLSYGFINGFGGELGGMTYKRNANPIRGGVGVATAITELFTVKLHVGWGYASYDGGASYNSPLVGTELGYRYSPVGRFLFSYKWDHVDSINADFYADHALAARVDHQFGKIVGSVHGDVRFRSYQGVSMALGGGTTRDDLIIAVGADASYLLKDWLAIVANYRTEVDQTAFRYMAGAFGSDNPSYVRTEITAGVRAAL